MGRAEGDRISKERRTKPARKGNSAGRPTLDELERRKAKVMKVATDLFVRQGYAATSLVDIAKQAGVATRTLYQHFGDKEAMFQSVMYARDSAAPPADGNWWAPLADVPANVAGNSPYNTTVPATTGLPPSPIAAPTWADVLAVAAANEASPSPNFFVVTDRCGRAHYAQSLAQFLFASQKAHAGCYNI